jgi:hypothetical protein
MDVWWFYRTGTDREKCGWEGGIYSLFHCDRHERTAIRCKLGYIKHKRRRAIATLGPEDIIFEG